jgi:hypothetical protein
MRGLARREADWIAARLEIRTVRRPVGRTGQHYPTRSPQDKPLKRSGTYLQSNFFLSAQGAGERA